MRGYLLVGDIGGTNARFALARDGVLEHSETVATADHASLESALRAYLQGKPAPASATLAVAAPVVGGRVNMTNSAWSFSQDSLAVALKCDVELINDFAALARAIPFLSPEDTIRIPRSAEPAGDAKGRMVALIGPGTGLGVATLLHTDGGWIDLPGEGGHATMAPATPEEDRIIARTRDRWEHVSAERFLSGEGLVTLYEACCALRRVLPLSRTAAAITATAVKPGAEPDAWLCAHAFDVFCAMLGTVAANLALTAGATGGVYIGGGILRRFPEFLAASRFRYRFEQKGRLSGYLRAIPTFLIVNPAPALIGLANWGQAHSAGKVAAVGVASRAPDHPQSGAD